MLFKKTSVIGHPISHSLSPKIHNYWIKESGIRAAKYEKIDVSPQSFDSEIERLINEGYGGLNVTVPLKELAYKKANKLSEVAKTTKAVNTLVFKDGNIFGTNTDPIGFESTLPKTVIEENVKNKKCLVLGAGGAARAIVYALHKLSANIWVFNRTHDKIKILKKDMKINFKSIERSELDTNLKNFDLIVNTTSLGLAGNEANDLVDFNKYYLDGPFKESGLALYNWSPIADDLKVLDKEIVLNSIKLKWNIVENEFKDLTKNLKFN